MLKIGIIGAHGKMGEIRRCLFSQLPNCQIVALCDTHQKNGDVPFFSTDPYDVIRHADVHAVAICTPNYLIKDLVVAALDNGKHVLCEKPPGVSLADVEQMKAALNRHPGLKLKFGFNHRYHDAILEAKRRIDSGSLGRVLWLRGRYGKSVDQNFAKTWRANKRLAGGGILLDQGIHMLDLFLLFCSGFDEVKAFASNQYWDFDIEDNVFAIFRNKEGQTASLHSTMTQWRHLFSLEIFLERGYMVINGILSSSGTYTNAYAKEELTVALNRSPAPQAKHTHEERLVFDQDYSFAREVDEFIDAIRMNSPIRVGTIDDAQQLMGLVDRIYANDQRTLPPVPSQEPVASPAPISLCGSAISHEDLILPRSSPANSRFSNRMSRIDALLLGTQVTNGSGRHVDPDQGFSKLLLWTRSARENGANVFLIGNGASASMASHIAADLCKNGNLRTQVFTDPSMITAVANDIGASDIFSTPLQRFAKPDELLIAISSSGSSPNILNAVNIARERGMKVITFSAMKPDNPLRSGGHMNFFVRARTYGEAETCHAALLHYWVDLVVGDIPRLVEDESASRTDRSHRVASVQKSLATC
jgi:predicted dehydrogenase/phosphoheptose isomerase